jgi:beta-lactamase regulating signal transducer with metallopeptidase domain
MTLPAPGPRVPAPEPRAVSGASSAAARALVLAPFAVGMWAAGAVFSLLVLLAGWWRLGWLAGRSTPAPARCQALAADLARALGVRRPVRLLRSAHPALLMTWGCFRPTVLLPQGADRWPDARLRVVLAHELAHVRRRDSAWVMMSALVRSIYWFNPLVWMAARRLRHESERCCDDAVLATGVDAPTYASELLALARIARAHHSRWHDPLPAAAMFGGSSLEDRIRALLDRRRRPTATPSVRVAIGLMLAGATIAAAAVRVSAERRPAPRLRVAVLRATDARLLPDLERQDDGAARVVDAMRRPWAAGAFRIPGFDSSLSGAGLTLQNVTVRELIRAAYGQRPAPCGTSPSCVPVVGGPTWLDSERFDVAVRVDDATGHEAVALLQRLLADRFQLKVHPEGDTIVVDRAERPEP